MLQLVHATRQRLTELGYSRSRNLPKTKYLIKIINKSPNSFRKQIKHFQTSRNLPVTSRLNIETATKIITDLKTRHTSGVSQLIKGIGSHIDEFVGNTSGSFLMSDFKLDLLVRTVLDEKAAYLAPIKAVVSEKIAPIHVAEG